MKLHTLPSLPILLSWLCREDYQSNVRKNWHVGFWCRSQQAPWYWMAPLHLCAAPKWKPWTSIVEAIQLSWLTVHFYWPQFASCPSVQMTNYCMEVQAWLPTPVPSGLHSRWLWLCWGQSNHSLSLYQVQDWPNPPFLRDWPHVLIQQKGPKRPSYHLLYGDPSPAWNLHLTSEGPWEILAWLPWLQTCVFSPGMGRNTNTDKSEKQ